MIDKLKSKIKELKAEASFFWNWDYCNGYICALSAVEGMIAMLEDSEKAEDSKKTVDWIDNADSYICPNCGFECNNPLTYSPIAECIRCGFTPTKYITKRHKIR